MPVQEDTPPPYVVSYSEAAEQWIIQVHHALAVRAADHAALPGRRYIADDADKFPGRTIHAVRVGSWRVLNELIDTDGDGLTDTLSVAYVRAAAQNTDDTTTEEPTHP